MDKTDHGIKRKSTIAVFEHVGGEQKQSKNKKFRTNRFLSEDSPSESELVIDDKPVRKKSLAAIKLSEEPLTLRCQWTNCTLMFMNYNFFIMHIMEHYQQADLNETLVCSWGDCGTSQNCYNHLKQHISYHGYVTKLINIGTNVLLRSNLPSCKESPRKVIFPIEPNGYLCEWEYCDKNLDTITEFIDHMIIHVKNNPRKSQADDVVKCYWKGCGNSFMTQYKLAEHIRVHTKEKTLACPTCFKTFSSKTKFRDHRKRQLSTDLQSYQCSQCLKLFASERLLRDHMRSHINHYKCNMCDMTCPKPSNLAMHIRMKHIKIKHFKCDKCSKGFVRLSNLRTHMLTHANHKYACEECDFKSKSLYALRKHYGVAHEQDIPVYQCHNCDESFKRGGHLTTHLMKKHNYHWPSGHSRFKYRRDHDGIFRLQTVRYESLEVTEEMIKSETQQKQTFPQSVSYNITYGDNNLISLPESDIKKVETSKVHHTSNNLLITIEDVDEHGNVMNSEVIESNELFLSELRDTAAESQTEDELGEFLILNSTNSIQNEQEQLDEHKTSIKRVENTTNSIEDTTDAKNSESKYEKSERKFKKLSNLNQIKDEVDDQVLSKPSKKKLRTCRGKRKTNVQVKAEEESTTETIHYFSKDIILNYDKFKIVSNKK